MPDYVYTLPQSVDQLGTNCEGVYVCICMYVCSYVCMYVCMMYVYMYV